MKRFKHFILANGVMEDAQKLHLFLMLIGASTFKLLSNLIAPQEPGDLSYTQVVKVMSHFKSKTLKISERFRFYRRSQLRGENVANYLAELSSEFGNFFDEALCNKFLCGLTDEAIHRRILAEADLTLTKALTLAQAMETAKKDLKEIHLTGVESEPTHHLSSHKLPKAVCHRCLGMGHLPGVCCFKSAKCIKPDILVKLAKLAVANKEHIVINNTLTLNFPS